MGLLQRIDVGGFVLVNQTLSTRLGDAFWPVVTDYYKPWPMQAALLLGWLWLIGNGRRHDRAAALLLVALIATILALEHAVLEPLLWRPRPCAPAGEGGAGPGVHLLVACGRGASFPSSHAACAFAAAGVLSYCRPRWRWLMFGFAAVVAVSRVAVGVHYPSDVLAGAVLGIGGAIFSARLWGRIRRLHQTKPVLTSSEHGRAP